MGNGFPEYDQQSRYNDLYMALFDAQADTHGVDGQRLWLPIDTSASQDVDAAVGLARRTFKSLEIGREQMAGTCFSRVFDASLALCFAKIRHSVTIGNVLVDRRPYYAVTMDSIRRDMEEGYLHDQPAVAHSWVTLENGVLLDFTILYAIARKEGRPPPKLIQGIYRSDEPAARDIRHIPIFLGPIYDLTVVSMPNHAAYEKGCAWVEMILDLIHDEKKSAEEE